MKEILATYVDGTITFDAQSISEYLVRTLDTHKRISRIPASIGVVQNGQVVPTPACVNAISLFLDTSTLNEYDVSIRRDSGPDIFLDRIKVPEILKGLILPRKVCINAAESPRNQVDYRCDIRVINSTRNVFEYGDELTLAEGIYNCFRTNPTYASESLYELSGVSTLDLVTETCFEGKVYFDPDSNNLAIPLTVGKYVDDHYDYSFNLHLKDVLRNWIQSLGAHA